ncbi:hypothetical protein HOD19_02605 [bacterium]|jgi:hypothetical protein|nr:hypothetical protein [bacterium]MBT4649073.1 hypothetical protein [bacterium]
MGKYCTCPIYFNIFVGLFLIALAIIGFINLFDVLLPLWLSMIILILGLLMIILNSINNSYVNANNLDIEQINKMHANEGY